MEVSQTSIVYRTIPTQSFSTLADGLLGLGIVMVLFRFSLWIFYLGLKLSISKTKTLHLSFFHPLVLFKLCNRPFIPRFLFFITALSSFAASNAVNSWKWDPRLCERKEMKERGLRLSPETFWHGKSSPELMLNVLERAGLFFFLSEGGLRRARVCMSAGALEVEEKHLVCSHPFTLIRESQL